MKIERNLNHRIRCIESFNVGTYSILSGLIGGKLSDDSQITNSWIRGSSNVVGGSQLYDSYIQ